MHVTEHGSREPEWSLGCQVGGRVDERGKEEVEVRQNQKAGGRAGAAWVDRGGDEELLFMSVGIKDASLLRNL